MKILIVDDAKETRDSLHNIIKVKINSTYEIAEAEDGLEALGIVETFHPDIVLTDILMPKMDGIRFTALLKSQPQTKHIFVAAITGLSGEEQIQKIYASGVDFYISKPFQLDDIVARLKVITSLITHKSSILDVKPVIVYNCFKDEHIKHYFVTFSIAKEDDLFLIFDYFSNQNISYNSLILKDFMVILVKAYRKIDTKNKIINLIIEESDSYIYITARDDFFAKNMKLLIKNNNPIFEYASTKKAFSFRINIISFIAKESKNNKSETNHSQNELMSSSELRNVSSIDLQLYVNELIDSLKDYRLLCQDGKTYNAPQRMSLINLFNKYTRLFKEVPKFERISIALQSVAMLIQDKKRKEFTKAQNTQMTKHIEELIIIIEDWIKNIIINKDIHNIHYADNKIMDICLLIENDFS